MGASQSTEAQPEPVDNPQDEFTQVVITVSGKNVPNRRDAQEFLQWFQDWAEEINQKSTESCAVCKARREKFEKIGVAFGVGQGLALDDE